MDETIFWLLGNLAYDKSQKYFVSQLNQHPTLIVTIINRGLLSQNI